MEAGSAARFRFTLPFPVMVEELIEGAKMTIKAKSSKYWLPRHVVAFGCSQETIVPLAGRLNLDDFGMSTDPQYRANLDLFPWGLK